MAKHPVDYVNLASLGVNVGKQWRDNFPEYSPTFCSKTEFLLFHEQFLAEAQLNNEHDALKKKNTAALKEVNATITTSTKRLKEYIRDAYSKDAEPEYAAYGLEKTKTNSYAFPKDNDSRKECLARLIARMSSPQNPLANRTQGLSYWTDLVTRHTIEWEKSKNLKSRKAELSENCKANLKKATTLQKKLLAQIKIDFEKENLATVRRRFGFLNETYQ